MNDDELMLDDDLDDGSQLTLPTNEPPADEPQEPQGDDEENQEEGSLEGEDDFITGLLKSKGIEDSSKIKFENEDGTIEEVDWNTLSSKEKLNIINSSTNDLNESEANLINVIRNSNLTPQEYLQYVQNVGVNAYAQSLQPQTGVYSTDQYSDEELYVMDLISKSQDITEEEALEALERAKSNSALFKKQASAIRNEYRRMEAENLLYAQAQAEQQRQAQFNQFAESIENSIINFKEFSGCQLNMDTDDMQEIYDFITTSDLAGNNWFSKALQDPDSVVQMAWFLLNGEQMIQDTINYYNNEITKVRKESYAKGLKDAKDKPSVAYKPKGGSKKNQVFDDLDDI